MEGFEIFGLAIQGALVETWICLPPGADDGRHRSRLIPELLCFQHAEDEYNPACHPTISPGGQVLQHEGQGFQILLGR